MRESFDAKWVADGECWRWVAALSTNGYGRIGEPGTRRSLYAHRVSYELHVGAVPTGLTVDHLCRNRWCVNPAHLEPVTRGENVLRGESLPAQLARMTSCKRGHPLRMGKRGRRECPTCAYIRGRRRRMRVRVVAIEV